jgi:hypothetical protein
MRALSVSTGLGETERGAFRIEGGARELSVGEEEDRPGGVQSM